MQAGHADAELQGWHGACSHNPRGTKINHYREEALMKYVLGLVLGIPIPILAIWFLVSHC